MPECKHEIEQSACGICTPPAEPQVQRPDDAWGPWFTARYAGHCAGCDGQIEPGDEIRADGNGGWLCTDCGDRLGGSHTVRMRGNLL